jgi:tetratricopeptide (TPR) repeat protein
MTRHFIFLLSAIFIVAVARASEGNDQTKFFDEGNRLYAEQNYEGAKKAYEKALSNGARSAAVFLNLGHAEYQLGRPALALINYQRALALDPAQDAARRSLEHVEKELGRSSKGLGFAEIAGRYVHFDLLALAGSLLVWSGLLLVLYAFFSTRRHGALAALGLLAAVLGATAVAIAWAGDSRVALSQTSVVTSDQSAFASPSENSQKLASLQAGDAVRVLAQSEDDWSLVKLPNDLKGWVRSASLQSVLPPDR